MSETNKPSLFVTFEGSEGSGKSTVKEVVVDWMRGDLQLDVVATREPGGTSVGEELRDVVHDKKHKGMSIRAEALIYQASRAELVEKVIAPALKEGKIVVSDRYSDSSKAYQGAGRELGEENIEQLSRFATDGLTPDLTLYFDVDLDVGFARRDCSGHTNRMDQQKREMYERAQAAYEQMCGENEGGRWVRIDANLPIDKVIASTKDALYQVLADNNLLREES